MRIRFEGHSDDLVQIYDWVPDGEPAGRYDVVADGGCWRFDDEYGCWNHDIAPEILDSDGNAVARVGLRFGHQGWEPVLKPLRDIDHLLFPAGMTVEFPHVEDGRHFAMIVKVEGEVTRGPVEDIDE